MPVDLDADLVVIGAGVVGLAVARALALAGRQPLVLEAEPGFGSGVSSRNSEVIHAGIYYRLGSLKARACRAGRDRLYAYAAERAVPHQRCGKLIVATTADQEATLEALLEKGRANGVDDLRLLSKGEAAVIELQVRCVAALLSPSSGIIDSHALMAALEADLENAGGSVVYRTRVEGGRLTDDGAIELRTTAGGEAFTLRTAAVVNAAALGAQAFALSLEGFPSDLVPPLHLAKGSYFSLSGRSPFRGLVYPVPEPGGLGVHATIDLAGQARFGPDVEWVEAAEYDVQPRRAESFYAAIRRYWPDLPDGGLAPAYAGIRPKLAGPGQPDADFMIQGPQEHDIPGVVHLFGIESPGLTAALALADEVVKRLC